MTLAVKERMHLSLAGRNSTQQATHRCQMMTTMYQDHKTSTTLTPEKMRLHVKETKKHTTRLMSSAQTKPSQTSRAGRRKHG